MSSMITAFFFTLACLGIALSQMDSLKKQVVTLQMDRDELRLHADQLAQIVTTQQFQIDVLTGMMEK